MYPMYCSDLRHEEAEQSYQQAMAYCDVHDIGTFAACVLGDRAGVLEKLGLWDECLSITHAMLKEQSVSPANRMPPLCYQAIVMARRGQDGFRPLLDEAMHLGLGLDEPYWVDGQRGKIFCLVEAPGPDAAATVHREAHGLVAEEIYEVQEGS
jgi:hypothetical protein